MFTALFMFMYAMIILVGAVFVGATLHHHWKTYMDRKRAELSGNSEAQNQSESKDRASESPVR